MKTKEIIETELSQDELKFLDRMVGQLRKEGYEGINREELITVIVKAAKESGADIKNMAGKLEELESHPHGSVK